jgi:dTDP-4-dehydrorhamnose 3,5-epimerase
MVIEETKIPEIKIIKPKVFTDNRGYFFESYNQKTFHTLGIENNFIQDNESFSKKGVIRGLHYQLSPYAQSKLVRVVKGKIFDVAVDIRKNSPTFGQWVGVELSDENKHQLLIPKGFAHGFVTLSEYAIVNYKCDELYNPEADRGIRFNDPQIGIDWRIRLEDAIVSAKDMVQPNLKDAEINFEFDTTY